MKNKILGLGIILVMIGMCGCGADKGSASGPSIMKDDEMSAEVESAAEGEGKENKTYKTPKDYIFSGDTENYLTCVYVKDTEVITASRYDFMGEGTDLLDITFTSHNKDYEDDGTEPGTDLWVRRSSFNEDSCTVTIHDWDYNNLDEPITVSFANDMSQIDVTALWKADITNEQAIFNGHYELYGTYTVDEMSEYFYVDGKRNFENIIDSAGTEVAEAQKPNDASMPSDIKVDEDSIEPDMLSGSYGGMMGQSTISISIYSSQEEGEIGIGNAEIYVEGGQYSYNGQIAGVAINVYEVMADTGEEVLLAVSTSDDGIIMLQLYVNGQLIEEYLMTEHYES